jgi:hypothetical protein
VAQAEAKEPASSQEETTWKTYTSMSSTARSGEPAERAVGAETSRGAGVATLIRAAAAARGRVAGAGPHHNDAAFEGWDMNGR